MKGTIEYNYNVNPYKDKFIDEFLKVFPDIYNKEQLDMILRNNVRDIEFNPTITNYNGRYVYNDRKIILSVIKNNVIFHEFIHGIRGNEQIPEFCENIGVVEAFTAYAERIYMYCSKNDFSINYNDNNSKYVFINDRKIKLELLPTYETLSLLAQQLEFLNFLIGEEETILTTFLKRENIYDKIKNIYLKYYEKIDSDKNEKDAKISTVELIKKINTISLMIKEENNLYEEDYILEEELDDEIQLFNAVNEIEKEIEVMFRTLNKNHSVSAYNMLSITNYLRTQEEKLLYTLFETESKDEIAIKQLLKTIKNN